jgi:hypothetical protein
MKKLVFPMLALFGWAAHGQNTPPRMSIDELASGHVLLSWPASSSGFLLQERTTLTPDSTWEISPLTPTENNGRYVVLLMPTEAQVFYQLIQTPTTDE